MASLPASVAAAGISCHCVLSTHIPKWASHSNCIVCCCCLQDVMFAFDRSKLSNWVADIKQLIKKDLRGIPGWGAHTR